MPSDIITSFVYLWIQQWAIESDVTVTISLNYANTDLTTKERVNVLPKICIYIYFLIWMKPSVSCTKYFTNKYLYSITKLDVMQLQWSFCMIQWRFLCPDKSWLLCWELFCTRNTYPPLCRHILFAHRYFYIWIYIYIEKYFVYFIVSFFSHIQRDLDILSLKLTSAEWDISNYNLTYY